MNTTFANSARSAGRLTLVAAAMWGSTLAGAADSAWYIGANGGQSTAKIDDPRISSGLLGSGFTSVLVSDHDRDNGYKLFGGYRLNPNFSVEAGYFDLGHFGFDATTLPPGTLKGNITLRGINIDLVGSLPITLKLSVFGRIGADYPEARDTFTGSGNVVVLNPSPSTFDTLPKVGLGVQYALSDSLAVRAEMERYRINDAIGNRGDVDLVSVGLVYTFGAKAPPAAAYVAAPAPSYSAPVPVVPPPPVMVPAPPAPAPIPMTPVPLPMPQKVSFSADSLFDFDSAKVMPAGQQQLDRLASELRGLRYDIVHVTGHTDRIGPAAYNLKLSAQRADVVSNYLVTSGGVPAAKIKAEGVDGSNPVTQAGDCPASLGKVDLIACLQPDRRVEILVSGAR